jgi:luciferase family oxidoreductase group 1
MDLSLVDLSPIPSGESATEAFEGTVSRARQAEKLGYSRFWVAEHHDFADRLAGTTPEVLLGYLAAETSDIRLGSGTVLLNHYSPYKVAESFGVLDALAPDRVDLGLGRATGSPIADLALQHDRSERRRADDQAEKVAEVASHLYDGFEGDHPFADLGMARSRESIPDIWVLGSSPSSAAIAGELGLRYCFAGFIRPDPAVRAFEVYRERFEPSTYGAGPDEPRGMVALNLTCAETDEKAARHRAVTEASRKRLREGRIDEPALDSTEAAIDELGSVPKPSPTPAEIEPGNWPRAISGSPETLREIVTEMAAQAGVEEVIVQDQHADPADTHRSHELLADAFGLKPR